MHTLESHIFCKHIQTTIHIKHTLYDVFVLKFTPNAFAGSTVQCSPALTIIYKWPKFQIHTIRSQRGTNIWRYQARIKHKQWNVAIRQMARTMWQHNNGLTATCCT